MKRTTKQQAIIKLVLQGLDSKEIAFLLNIKVKTVKYHLTNLYKLSNVTSRSEFLAQHIEKLTKRIETLEMYARIDQKLAATGTNPQAPIIPE